MRQKRQNSVNDEVLENLARECDISLGANNKEIGETISSMKMEEQFRAAMAEANYKAIREKILVFN